MNYITIKTYDIANGPGVRVTIFVAGCPHEPKCPYCFNPETYDFNGGKPFTKDTLQFLMESAGKEYISGITLLGGEPLDIRNQEGLLPFVKAFKEKYPEKNVWCYTGFLYEEILKMYENNDITKQLLPMIDVLVDGKFINELKDLKLSFRGSSNQRIILVQDSLKENKIIEWVKPEYK